MRNQWYDTLIVAARERPGTVNAVTGRILQENIDIAFLRIERQRYDGRAIMVLEMNEAIEAHLN